ncbi:DUF4253 domain-containing protein [Croceitalea sp. MTPC5]|uniref:DUF4253 domain-containing protein n=1 Tax=Croceitalea sp. MTPC5 TaxID=3056565 RepID=UPI002B39C516|nr:DUF4253 domain-containing protein [Croceitalea sp. MTPC5]
MKNLTIILILVASVSGCNLKNKNDQILAKEVSFDDGVIELLRKETKSEFTRLKTEIISVYPDREEKQIIEPNAIEFEINGDNSLDLVLRLKDKLKPMGYYVFRSEQNFGYSKDKIAVIKTEDQFDILRYQATNGGNYDIDTDSIINELKRWDEKYNLEILGADFDWVEGQFLNPPKNFTALADKMYEFCPDIVDQGTGDIETLEEELSQSNQLFLWWD